MKLHDAVASAIIVVIFGFLAISLLAYTLVGNWWALPFTAITAYIAKHHFMKLYHDQSL